MNRPKVLHRFEVLNQLFTSIEMFDALKWKFEMELHDGTVHDDAIVEQFDVVGDTIKELMLMIDPTIFDGEEQRCS